MSKVTKNDWAVFRVRLLWSLTSFVELTRPQGNKIILTLNFEGFTSHSTKEAIGYWSILEILRFSDFCGSWSKAERKTGFRSCQVEVDLLFGVCEARVDSDWYGWILVILYDQRFICWKACR